MMACLNDSWDILAEIYTNISTRGGDEAGDASDYWINMKYIQ